MQCFIKKKDYARNFNLPIPTESRAVARQVRGRQHRPLAQSCEGGARLRPFGNKKRRRLHERPRQKRPRKKEAGVQTALLGGQEVQGSFQSARLQQESEKRDRRLQRGVRQDILHGPVHQVAGHLGAGRVRVGPGRVPVRQLHLRVRRHPPRSVRGETST